ncbi:MAG: hypothetical protein NT141_04535 [candidate division WWE3 bacterium]|nr:hypothetical protein [candidate division WWE3 bacterium]
MKNARATTIGHVILLSPKIEVDDINHELIHVVQNQKAPLIQPFLYYFELLKNGYKNNKYEVEAYKKSESVYHEK